MTAETDRLRLQREARAGGGGHAERAAERSAEGGADAGDLVLGLERRDAEALVLAELVEDVGGRGDRVGPEEQRQPRLRGPGDQAVGQREVAGDVAVGAAVHRSRLDLVLHHERLGGLTEVPAGLERRDVGVADVGGLGEASLEERGGGVGGAAVHPRQQSEREHVLRAARVLARQPELLHGLHGHGGELEGVHVVLGERLVLERVLGVAGLGEVARGEVVGVDDDRRALLDVGEVRPERGRVHRDEDVGGVPGREDVVVGEVDLERRDTGQGALGRPDLRREVGQGGEVVAEGGGLLGEAVAGELHAVAGVAGEPDDHAVELLDLLGHACRLLSSRGRGSRAPWRGFGTGRGKGALPLPLYDRYVAGYPRSPDGDVLGGVSPDTPVDPGLVPRRPGSCPRSTRVLSPVDPGLVPVGRTGVKGRGDPGQGGEDPGQPTDLPVVRSGRPRPWCRSGPGRRATRARCSRAR